MRLQDQSSATQGKVILVPFRSKTFSACRYAVEDFGIFQFPAKLLDFLSFLPQFEFVVSVA